MKIKEETSLQILQILKELGKSLINLRQKKFDNLDKMNDLNNI